MYSNNVIINVYVVVMCRCHAMPLSKLDKLGEMQWHIRLTLSTEKHTFKSYAAISNLGHICSLYIALEFTQLYGGTLGYRQWWTFVHDLSLHCHLSMAEFFPEMFRWCSFEQACCQM